MKIVELYYFTLHNEHVSCINSFVIFRDSDDDQDNASDLSEIEVLPPAKSAVTPTNEKEDMDEDANVQLIDHDWSFLFTILPEQDNAL